VSRLNATFRFRVTPTEAAAVRAAASAAGVSLSAFIRTVLRMEAAKQRDIAGDGNWSTGRPR